MGRKLKLERRITRGTHEVKITALDGTPAKILGNEAYEYYGRKAVYRNGWTADDLYVTSKNLYGMPLYKTYRKQVEHDTSQIFSNMDAEHLQLLLSMLLEKPVILTGVEEAGIETDHFDEEERYSHEDFIGHGYTNWIFYYRYADDESAVKMKARFFDILLERGKTYEEDMRKAEESYEAIFGSNFII